MSGGRFAGVDWASEEHAVCVVDERGRIVQGRRYRHDEPGIRALCSRLVRLGVALVAVVPVTLAGVYHMTDSSAAGATWENITGNLFNVVHDPFGEAPCCRGGLHAADCTITRPWGLRGSSVAKSMDRGTL